VSLHEVDTVFHLGAQTLVGTALRSPLLTFEANIRGTYHLLEACRRMQPLVRRVVVASSDKAYGEARELPYTEETPLLGRHPYDVSKSCTDLLAVAYASTYDLPVTIARCGNVYGGGDLNWSRIVPGTIRSLLRGERPLLRSDGSMTRDYIFVEDAVDAYLKLAEALDDPSVAGQAFNFAHGSPMSVLEIVDAIRTVMGATDLQPEILDTARSEIPHQHLDSSKARRQLGWEPGWQLHEGLGRTVEWYRSYLADRP
jgi:CDP-glucose 4,6-dehydratase